MTMLPNKALHLWNFNVSEFLHQLEIYETLLSPEEMERANRYKFAKDRTVYILARGILRILSGRYLNQIPESIKFKYNKYGKPDYDFRTQIKFNVSHSGNLIVMAFAKTSDIGIDVEKMRNDFDVMKIAQNFFSPDEIHTLEALPEKERIHGFYTCWTRKESFIKAKGSGLSFPLTSFSVSLDINKAQLLRTAWDAAEKEKWHLFTFAPTIGYVGAISVRGDLLYLQHKQWESL
ncbi:hypothetical protein LCGC14_1500200 [marine sediment metagenome]|uniref:Uncharacterized protein n=1 Tax=marine sediment metagenome TaxID=412755 RepID=A0A0F9M5R6_9ZZZZ